MEQSERNPVPVEKLAEYLRAAEKNEATILPWTFFHDIARELYEIKKGSKPGAENLRIADALEGLLWPNMALGNKAVIQAAIEALRTCHTQPAPIIPTFDQWLEGSGQKPLGWVKEAMRESYDGCRDTVLASKTS